MSETLWILVLAVVLIGAAVLVATLLARRRSRDLHRSFGPEYERAVAVHGDRRSAEEDLEERRSRVAKLELRDLDPDERAELGRRWEEVQGRFVDQPAAAVAEGDHLLGEAMRGRGYPLEDIMDGARRADDLSVDQPEAVTSYREAAAIAERSRRNEATTEELRRAMVCLRTVFEGLVGAEAHPAAHAAVTDAPRRAAR